MIVGEVKTDSIVLQVRRVPGSLQGVQVPVWTVNLLPAKIMHLPFYEKPEVTKSYQKDRIYDLPGKS